MSSQFHCDDKEALIAYLYDEIDAESRQQVSAHLRSCAACASEVAALQSVRQDLASWQPPEAQLDFAIVQKTDNVLRPARWYAPASMPAWARVAAAVLVLAAGAAVANLQVRYGGDGLTISTGWMAPRLDSGQAGRAPAAIPQTESNRVAPAPIGVESRAVEDWHPAFAALESNLRRELQMVRASAATSPVRVRAEAPATVDTDALMKQLQALVDKSEQRQRQELATRMVQFRSDLEMQRRGDLVRISQDLGQLRGRTGVMEGSQRAIANILQRVSTTQVP